jgi:prevent-host-death family protein
VPSHDDNVVSASEVGSHFDELLDRVEAGHEITSTREGVPVARLVPFRRIYTPAERRAAFEAMDKLAVGITLGGLRIKDLIE